MKIIHSNGIPAIIPTIGSDDFNPQTVGEATLMRVANTLTYLYWTGSYWKIVPQLPDTISESFIITQAGVADPTDSPVIKSFHLPTGITLIARNDVGEYEYVTQGNYFYDITRASLSATLSTDATAVTVKANFFDDGIDDQLRLFIYTYDAAGAPVDLGGTLYLNIIGSREGIEP